jgi:hypothetical protein
MRSTIAYLHLAQSPDMPNDEEAAEFAVAWEARIVRETFAMLIEEGRTIV